MSTVYKGFFEDYNGEEILSDVRNFKNENDFIIQAQEYVKNMLGRNVPLVNVSKANIIINGDAWRYKLTAEDEGFTGEEIEVYRAELDYET